MNAGKIPIGVLLSLTLVVAGGWSGWQLGKPWLSFFEYRDEVRELVKVAPALGPDRFKQRVYQVTQERNPWIEDPKHEVHLTYAANLIKVSTDWTAYVFFPFDIEYHFDFSVDEERAYE
jgi:hypothetical protein